MKTKELSQVLRQNRRKAYENPDSIIKQYDEFLLRNGLYRGGDVVTYKNNLKGHIELADNIIKFYHLAKLPNEKEAILEDLYATGYREENFVQLILDEFLKNNNEVNLWTYGDLLYRLKNYKYMEQYLEIIQNKRYGIARQMLVSLVGKSKKEEVIPILIELLKDKDVEGHALSALGNFRSEYIDNIMKNYLDYHIVWIRRIAEKYLKVK